MFQALHRHYKESPDGDIEVDDGISDSSETKGGHLIHASVEAQINFDQESPRASDEKNLA